MCCSVGSYSCKRKVLVRRSMIKLCGEDKVNYFCLLPIRRNRSMCDKNVLRQFKLPTFSAYVGSLLPLPMLE